MSMCFNPRCDGTNWLCGKCKKRYPTLVDAIARRKREQRQAEAQERRDNRNRVGLIGDTAIAASALSGLVTNPVQPPNTDQLNDAHQSQIEGRRQSIPQATRDQGSGRSGSSRHR